MSSPITGLRVTLSVNVWIKFYFFITNYDLSTKDKQNSKNVQNSIAICQQALKYLALFLHRRGIKILKYVHI